MKISLISPISVRHLQASRIMAGRRSILLLAFVLRRIRPFQAVTFSGESLMTSTAKLCAICVLSLLFSVCAQAQQKLCVTASKFGPDDQIGNVNYITPAKTLAATKLVTKGKAYRLGIETNKDT